MNDEALLTLHCPQCKEITEVVSEGDDLVCLDCGWRFDEKVAARLLNSALPPAEQSAPADLKR